MAYAKKKNLCRLKIINCKKKEQHKSEIKFSAISVRNWPLEGKKTFVSKSAPWYLSTSEWIQAGSRVEVCVGDRNYRPSWMVSPFPSHLGAGGGVGGGGSLLSWSQVWVIMLRIFVNCGRSVDRSRSLIKERDCSLEVNLKIQTACGFEIWDKLTCWLGFSCYQSRWHPCSNEERKPPLVGKSFCY